MILVNISLCFMWDFDYFVESYLKLVNLLIKRSFFFFFLDYVCVIVRI